MLQTIDCPYCGNQANLQKNPTTLFWKNKQWNVIEYVYECSICEERFEDEDTMKATLHQLSGYKEWEEKTNKEYEQKRLHNTASEGGSNNNI